MKTFGAQSMVGELKKALLMNPADAFRSQDAVDREWKQRNWISPPDFRRAVREYDSFVQLLLDFGVELAFLPAGPGLGMDAIYTRDPALVTHSGAVMARMGNPSRDGEPQPQVAHLQDLGIPLAGMITGDGRLEGGDLVWLDERTLAVGEGFRSNLEGIRQLQELIAVQLDTIIPVPLPYWNGPTDCLHLMSILSPVDHDVSLVYSRLMAVPFRQKLLDRGVRLVEVPDEEYESLGCNVLALAPGICIMLAGNPVTRARLEAQGIEVSVFDGQEICLKGLGGPTCLTQPLLRQ